MEIAKGDTEIMIWRSKFRKLRKIRNTSNIDIAFDQGEVDLVWLFNSKRLIVIVL